MKDYKERWCEYLEEAEEDSPGRTFAYYSEIADAKLAAEEGDLVDAAYEASRELERTDSRAGRQQEYDLVSVVCP